MNPSRAILSPARGTLIPLANVPDTVFSQQMLGPGCAIQVPDEDISFAVTTPLRGVLTSVRQHAFIVQSDESHAVLVHLGLDTYNAEDGQFKPLGPVGSETSGIWQSGQRVEARQPIIQWRPTVRPALVLLTILELPGDWRISTLPDIGQFVELHDNLLQILH